MITSIRPYNLNYTYQPKFTASKEEYTAVVSYENFTEDLLDDLVEEWDEEGYIEDGDSLYIMPLSYLEYISNFDKKIAKTYPKARLSQNGFGITIRDKDGGLHTEALRYFDPRVNTILKATHAVKNDFPLIIPILDAY